MDIPPVIPFPGSYDARESDEYYRGYWEGLSEWQDIAAKTFRRDRILYTTIAGSVGFILGIVVSILAL